MKMNKSKYFLLFIFLMFSNISNAQQSDSVKQQLEGSVNIVKSLDDTMLITKMLEKAKDMYSWQVQENDQAYMLTVDIPYPEIQNPKDYFSITVVKFKNHKRPRVISFALSSMVDKTKGLNIYFAGYSKDHVLQMSNVQYENIPFTEITSEYLKVSADYMYLDKEEKKDLFDPMLNNNYIVFNFYGIDGQLFKVGYPLLWFKEKIEELK